MNWPSSFNPNRNSSLLSRNLASTLLSVEQAELLLFVKELNPDMFGQCPGEEKVDWLKRQSEEWGSLWSQLSSQLPVRLQASHSHALCCKWNCRGGRKHQALIVIQNLSQCWGRKSKYFIEKVVAYNVKFIDKEAQIPLNSFCWLLE